MEEHGHDENKPILKLIMDPRGQVQDIGSLRKQGYNIEPAALSPDVCMDIVRDLNSPKGKGTSITLLAIHPIFNFPSLLGAELFAKRRKRSEKWVVGENSSQQTTETSEVTSYSSSSTQMTSSGGSQLLSKLPPISYLEGSTQRVQNAIKLDEIQV